MGREDWWQRLGDAVPEAERARIQEFASQLRLRSEGRVDEKLFAETRLRVGAYGQRYDNGQRHDGAQVQSLPYLERPGKGPNTHWDAPGMQRIKIPLGRLLPEQMTVLADLAEEYADEVLHVTTRQDIQLHFVHLEDTPDLMLRLAAAGVTTQEACGNTVRNVTACVHSGGCATEQFDVGPYASAIAAYLLGHPDAQHFGRKFKLSFSGCAGKPCGLARIHDLGFVAVSGPDGRLGFEAWVGGGLGAVPQQAQRLYPFVAVEELAPLCRAVCRVFAQHGEKKNRARARLKFLVSKLGVEDFRAMVEAERAALPDDPKGYPNLPAPAAPAPGRARAAGSAPEGVDAKWWQQQVAPDRDGAFQVAVSLPLGDVSAAQFRALADVMRRLSLVDLRLTVEQGLLLRGVPEDAIGPLFDGIRSLGLDAPDAETIRDVTACPGTDTCKLGIASSRGLAAELRRHLAERGGQGAASDRLRVKASGCFNACAQHHVADIGFHGVSRKKGSRTVPHFQVVLGGQWTENGAAYGLPLGAVPSKRVPAALDAVTQAFDAERGPDESFQAFVARLGKAKLRGIIEPFMEVPPYEVDRSFYADWGDPREFSMKDHGVGECAGEVVPRVEVELQASERLVFEAQLRLDEGASAESVCTAALGAMCAAARALLSQVQFDVPEAPPRVRDLFRRHFCDNGRFYDPYAGAKFANYFLRDDEGEARDEAAARQRIQEAQLFVEAAYACYERENRVEVSS